MPVEINQQTEGEIDLKELEKTAQKWQEIYDCSGLDLSIALVSDERIRELNRDYRQQDRVTDVLSFPDEEALGELILAPDQIRRQAPENKHSFEKELVFMLVHGLFHLLGFEDDTEAKKQKMIKMGQDFIDKNMKQ